MAFAGMNREIRKVGVIGSGNIGPDITLFLSKVFTPHGVPVVLVDIAPEALERGRARIRKKLDKGVTAGAFQPDFADRMIENIRFTTDYADLSGADLVIEAATEELSIKEKIFAELERVCAPDALLASNSSHLEPDVIFGRVREAHRCLVAHFFFPAERNLIVEIVPHAKTDRAITTFAMKFFEAIGKVPIRVKGRYGYAVNPVFEGLFHAALLLVDRGYASEKVVDAIAQKALKMGVGPFTGMNLTGGTPITYRGMQHYHTKIMPWFEVHPRLEERFRSGEPWPAAGRGEVVEYDEATYEAVAKRLQGAYLGLVNEVYGSGIVELGDLELAVETALVIEGPFKMMNRLGIETALSLVQA
ncbi:MAG: 3-hydroxyacyl-CoA dehydrogenase family protein, partial [Deltaproteobacteria bacterium]